MCSSFGDNVVYETTSCNPQITKHEIIKCSDCGSLYYSGEDPVLGYENEAMNKNYWIHYAQIGAGITAMLEPLFYLGAKAKGSLLDVGCGFGYVVDFYNKMGYGEAIGLETAVYGKIGSELLGAPIINSYYADCTEIKEKKYDIIFSCEVLEHVPDPRSFINEISAGLDEKGILVLTTPSSNVIYSQNNPAEVIASLSPDYHFFLSSPDALEKLLRSCGYKDIRIDDNGSRLYAWASREKLPILQKHVPWNDYFQYLKILSINFDSNVKTGALQRLFKDAWNTGNYEIAINAYKQLEDFTLDEYNLDFTYPDIHRYNSRKSIVDSIQKNPVWYGSVLYYGALLVGEDRNELRKKFRMLDSAFEILKYESSFLDPRLIQESQHLLPYIENELLKTYEDIVSINALALRFDKTNLSIRDIIRIITNIIKRLMGDISWWKNNWKTRL